jgi:malate dehydrogenase (oxaloacetate-decarboxylating)(NADP+)
VPGQGNNAYIFPGVGLGAIASGASSITDDDFYIAAASLASQVPAERLALGCVYPSFDNIRAVSLNIGAAVATAVFDSGRATVPRPPNILLHCSQLMYTPSY